MGHLFRDFFLKELYFSHEGKTNVFMDGNRSFVEAPWQPFNKRNCSPQSPFVVVKTVYY